jgi:hypothetical protein
MMIRSRLVPFLLILTTMLFSSLFVPGTLLAQSGSSELRIIELDTSAFPEITVRLQATDAAGNAITDPSALRLQEDEFPIVPFYAAQVDPGAELIIIIDANTTIEQRDGSDDLSRREKVRDSIIRYANHFMDPMQKDRVTIIVPEGAGARILDKEDLSFPNEVINAANFYQSGELGDTDLNRMFQLALDVAMGNREEGRRQSILLFSDAADLDENLDIDRLSEEAMAQDVTLYAAILGSRADSEEIANITRFTDPTDGAYVHMPDPVLGDPLYEAIQQRASQLAIAYQSSLNSSGQHTLFAEIADAQTAAEFDLVVEPPLVQMAVDNSRPIRRVAESVETPLELMLPTEQPLVAQVEWPDEHPRELVSADLLIEGVELPADQAILDDTGLLTFIWDIGQLDGGIYDLQVRVIDELGLVGISEPLPLTIVVERPSLAPAETIEPDATSVPTPAPTLAPLSAPEEIDTAPIGIAVIVAGALLLLALLATVIVAVIFLRNRSGGGAAVPPSADELPASARNTDYTYIVPPEFAIDDGISAYLEVLEHAPEHQGLIPIVGNNVAIGRDARRAQVVFDDRSVSRLHARILESHGEYRIYEEGSSSGTYVNFERIGMTPQTLEDMDRIHLGRVHLRFHLSSSLRSATGESDGTSTEVARPNQP